MRNTTDQLARAALGGCGASLAVYSLRKSQHKIWDQSDHEICFAVGIRLLAPGDTGTFIVAVPQALKLALTGTDRYRVIVSVQFEYRSVMLDGCCIAVRQGLVAGVTCE